MTHQDTPPPRQRTFKCLQITVLMVLFGGSGVIAQESNSQLVQGTSCFIRTFEEATIPALEAGMISQVKAQLGEVVQAGQILVVLDDREAELQSEMARVQLRLAEKKHADSFTLRIADARLKETEQTIAKSHIEQKIAEQTAASTIAIQQAQKALATAQADLDRAIAARKDFAGAISEAEMNRLTFIRDSSQLDVESALEQAALERLKVSVEASAVATFQAILERLQHERSQAVTDQEVSKIDLERLRLQLLLAETKLKRRQLVAPFSGMLVEQHHHLGEWIEPGEPVFRIVRLDQLVVEGYADAARVHHSLRGARVLVRDLNDPASSTFEGELMFVSPEIDPVNQQVQVRAIVDNASGQLRAGQAVAMSIVLP